MSAAAAAHPDALAGLHRAAGTAADLRGAMTYLEGAGLLEITTITAASLHRGAAQVTCDTDVMMALVMLADEALKRRASFAQDGG